MAPLLLALVLAAAPQRYLLTVGDAPLAELRVERDGARYRYEATHLLEEGPAQRRLEFTLDAAGRVDGLTPEVLALATRPAAGCVQVLEEVTRQPEALCVHANAAAEVTGTIAGRSFSATYDARGALQRLVLGAARWDALPAGAPTPAPGASPFTHGFAVHGEAGDVALVPPVPGARRLSRPPEGVGDAAAVGRLRCLVAARRFVEAHPGATVVLGLVVEAGRAWPHAWVRLRARELDPSVQPGDDVLAARQYLALPTAQAGRVYLELVDGARRVARGPASRRVRP